MQKLSEWKAEQFGGVRVQLGRGWHMWRQRCSALDTGVSGGQKTILAEEEDAVADSWAEVMAAVEMAIATEATNRAVSAEAVRAENPLFQSMGVEETAMIGEVAAAATNATMDTEMAAAQ